MKQRITRRIAAMVVGFGLALTVSVPTFADSDTPSKPTDYVSEYKSTKGEYESALASYEKTPNANRAAKAAMRLAAQDAQKKAEANRLAALMQVFNTYTTAINRANTAYQVAMVAAKKDAAAKVAAKNTKNADVAAATAAYNLARNQLKALPKVK